MRRLSIKPETRAWPRRRVHAEAQRGPRWPIHVDDRAGALAPQRLERRLHAINLPHQIDLDDALDLPDRHVGNRGVLVDAGIVNPGVDTPEAPHGLLGQALDLAQYGDVGHHCQRAAFAGLDLSRDLIQGLAVAHPQHDRGASRAEGEGTGAANAARRTSDHNNRFRQQFECLEQNFLRTENIKHRRHDPWIASKFARCWYGGDKRRAT